MSSPSVAAHRLGWQYPYLLLRGSLAVSILLILAIAAYAPWAMLYLPLVLVGAIGGWWLFKRPVLNLFVILACFVSVAEFDEGISVTEVAYALLYTGYFAQWFFRRVVISPEPLIRSSLDRLVVFFLFFVTAYACVGLVFGAPARAAIVELQSWTLLLFYFPVKEVVEKRDDGLKWLLVTVTWLGLFVVVRNIFELAYRLLSVTEVWQVTIKGRVVANEMLMIVPGFAMLILATGYPKRTARIGFFGLFLILVFGLLITQGRGNWLAFAFGLGVLFFVSDRQTRKSMLGWGSLAFVGSFLLIFVFFGDHALLLITGTVNRILSIGSATSGDTSFVSRLIEWESVLSDIKVNPILGYGMGVPISYFDITRSVTMVRPWIHSGYLGVWFKYGLFGLVLHIGLIVLAIRTAYTVIRLNPLDPLLRTAAYTAVAGLSCLFVLTIPTNVWQNSDSIIMITIMIGMASGAHARTRALHEQ